MPDITIPTKLAELKLCDHCLGRLYGMRGHGLTNEDRGRAIRVLYAMEHDANMEPFAPEDCILCGGLFSRLDEYAKYIVSRLREYEFTTFSVGSRFPHDVLEREKTLQAEYASEEYGESIGREFNRELGKKISELTNKEVNLSAPDIAIIVDTEYDDIKFEIKPLYIYGRYRKLVRGIPQTKWPSGKYTESVEEIIAAPVMKLTEGEAHALHGMGREDIDVRMLGTGRPFVLEIKRPKKRTIDLKKIEEEINTSDKVEVTALRFTDRKEVVRIKSAKPKKRYQIGVVVDCEEDVIIETLKKLKGKIKQRTPKRVAHRRADKVRIRTVYDIQLVGRDSEVWLIDVLAESGTYIKELMHGDGGRTKPSLAELLKKEVKVSYLDVLEVLDEETESN